MPESFFVLSKENRELAADEIAAIAKSHDRFSKIGIHANLALVQTRTPWQKIHRRASYVKNSGRIVKRLSDLFSDGGRILHEAGTFACRVLNLTRDRFDPADLERSMGEMISGCSSARVSLNPGLVVYLIAAGRRSFLGFSTRLQERGRQKRVRGHPNQLDWRLSRAMINLCGLKEEQTVCDPFCGTGTTLLEAESMGIHGIGIDISRKMSDIARKNVAGNGYGSEIINGDFGHITRILDRFDGVVTDIPYGRNSEVPTRPEALIRDLIERLPKRKRFCNNVQGRVCRGNKAKNIKKYSIYRHKSLTRTILVK